MNVNVIAAEDRRRTTMAFDRRTPVAVALALVFLTIVGAAGTNEFAKAENDGCTAVKRAWGTRGLGSHMVPRSQLPGL